MNIKDKLKELRTNNGLTQGAVADAIHLKRSTYQAYEEGRAEPSIDRLKKLCTLYNIKMDVLTGGTGRSNDRMENKMKNILEAYYALSIEKRKIVDFIMGI